MITKVLKFGGSSFSTLESYRQIARYLKARLSQDADRLVVVVSAMSGTTGRIQEAGLSVNPGMSLEVTDSLLATGEMVAAALMRTAIEAEGIRASHLSGYQLGIRTDSKFTRARIQSVDQAPLLKALCEAKVVVVAGGQAINQKGQLTMLGRNSSDFTAVAVAAALWENACEIFSDVPGVYTADPYTVPDARPLREVPYDQIIEMSRSGSKVLHHGSVAYAKKHGIKILCRSIQGDHKVGSLIGSGSAEVAVSSNSQVHVLRYPTKSQCLRSAKRLAEEDIISIPVATEKDFLLCVSKENRAWSGVVETLQDRGLPLENHTLVTLHLPDKKPRRYCVPSEQAPEKLRELHAQYWEASKDASVRQLLKIRSKESGILVGV